MKVLQNVPCLHTYARQATQPQQLLPSRSVILHLFCGDNEIQNRLVVATSSMSLLQALKFFSIFYLIIVLFFLTSTARNAERLCILQFLKAYLAYHITIMNLSNFFSLFEQKYTFLNIVCILWKINATWPLGRTWP